MSIIDQFGNDSGSASALTFSGSNATTSGSLFAGDVDYFEFTLTQPSEITAFTTGGTDTRGTLFDLLDDLAQ